MKKITFSIVFFLLFSVIVFGQSYMGPDSGGVASGVVVTTDDFVLVPIGSEPPSETKIINIEESDFGPMYYIGDKEVFDNYVYVEDESTNYNSGGEIGINFELHSFFAMPMGNSIPPDNHVAVGPNHVVTTVNSRFHIYDREGNLLKNIDADAWTTPVLPNPGAFDPQIIYDHYENRWFMLWDSQDNGTQTGNFLISYSDDSDPLGTWYMYALDATLNGTTATSTWGDYPQLGYDDQAIYIMSRQFAFAGGYNYNKIRILTKSELYSSNTAALSWMDIYNISQPGSPGVKPDVIHPSISYDPGTNESYFVWANRSGGDFYILYKITNPISNPVLTGINLPVPFYFESPNANQLGGGTPRISANGSHIKTQPVLRDGILYAVHSIENSSFSGYTSLKYFTIDVTTNSIIDQVEQGADRFFYIYPAITVDKDHNLAITYSRSADTEYIGAYYSTKLGTDPPGLSPSKVMMEGQGNYVVTFGGTRNRWGDYLSAALDPVNQYNIWLFSEYAAATNTWGTWLTEIRMKPFPGVSLYTNSNPVEFGALELNDNPIIETFIISNRGEDSLIINKITSPTGPFTLLTPLNYPVILSTFDSLDLEIEFNPTSPAIYNELMAFDDNDPNFDGITLNGTAFVIKQAYTDVLYASTGIAENGKTLTVNRNNGTGSELGLSNFEDLISLTIDPITNIMYGISPDDFSTELARVNGTGGDSFTQYTLGLGNMVGIGFTATGTLYGALRNGDIYTIDLTDGSFSFVVTADRQLASMEIDPTTDVMYSAPRIVIGAGKDRIYTVNTTTGETTLIGETGFGVTTNDMAFDENGVMYGVIGGSNEEGQLITINTTDGAGSLVGGIGFQNVLGLGYAVNGIVISVTPDDDKDFIPKEFALSQNYPNPFNPNTSIEFSVPVNSNVRLTIYNLLGQVVTTLVSEEISAGNYNVIWNGTDKNGLQVSSGVYLYKMKANGTNGKDFQEIRKMVLLK